MTVIRAIRYEFARVASSRLSFVIALSEENGLPLVFSPAKTADKRINKRKEKESEESTRRFVKVFKFFRYTRLLNGR